MNPNGLSAKGRKQLADFESALLVSADSNARRQAILHEIAAHAALYEADVAPNHALDRYVDLQTTLARLHRAFSTNGREAALRELAGRCVAWLEHLSENEAKA